MKSVELRRKFLEFFKERGHSIISGASLIPENDATTLFASSGMQPLIPYLLGKKHPLGNRLANFQKCFRTADIEEVGDDRHTTFFEMLGNWSLGDYFKKEQLNWVFDFLTQELKIDPQRLYVSVFRGNKDIGIEKDCESAKIWKEIFSKSGIKARDIDFSEKNGMRGGRIFYYDETRNWWSRAGAPAAMPLGEPGGPDSEIFYDFGENLKRHQGAVWKNKPCHINCDCGRFVEIGNSVFMEYVKTENGFEKLAQKNVDFGGGLERITAAVQNKTSVFETDLFLPIINEIPGQNEKAKRIIADHIKGAVFLISEGIFPSNAERGYILRRLLRRAVRYGKLINLPKNFLIPLAQKTIEIYKDVYPEIKPKETAIFTAIQNEGEKFEKTLKTGIKEFNKLAAAEIDVQGIFKLYATYGFPPELTEELAKEKGIILDLKGLKKKIQEHREVSRAGAEKKFGGVGKEAGYESAKLHTAAHLLHRSLRKILGENVRQMGSDINPQRLRFDFSHPQKMTDQELARVEELVNQKIKESLDVKKEEMSCKEALRAGALAFFREKYPEVVTVYSINNWSKEICAGPHVKNTSELGSFKIIKEESSAAGIRRIRAILQ